MSDVEDGAGAPPVREKLVGATSVACPMLSSTNYMVWSLRMKVILRIHKSWSVIDPGEENEEKNCLAMGLLYQAIPESLIMQIGDVDKAKVLWESIRVRHVGADRVKEARLQTLTADLDRLKMQETETIDGFAGKLSGIASKSASLGEPIAETKLVKKLLTVVPHRFIQIVASLEQVLDLKTVTFDDVVGRLKAYEERIRGDEGGDEQQKVLFTRSTGGSGGRGGNRDWNRAGSCDRRGNGGGWFDGGGRSGYGGWNSGQDDRSGSSEHGGRDGISFSGSGSYEWGRNKEGKGFKTCGSYGGGSGPSNQAQNKPNSFKNKPNQPEFNFNSDPNRDPEKDLSKVICYRCDKPGHYASKCPERIQKFQESNFCEHDDTDEAVFLHETVFERRHL